MSFERFFSDINYSAANEDGRSEQKALRLGPQDRVLCVTASGQRPLDLALDAPREIIAIDFNPAQSYMLALKMAAIAGLDHAGLLAFLGATACDRRLETYDGLRANLDSASREFWDRRRNTIGEGVLYCGRWEGYLRTLAFVLKVIRPGLVESLFRCESVEEQAEFWRERWDRWPWRAYQWLIGRRFVWKYLLREPGIRFVPRDFSISDYFLERFAASARHTLFRESPFAWLMMRGRWDVGVALPPHLQARNFDRLRGAMGCIRIVTASLSEHLASPASGSFDAFSLSDFGSYASEESYQAVWSGLLARAAPGARVCERQLCVKHEPPTRRFVRDPALEAELQREDDSFFYSFVAGHVE